jgi:glutaredoxin
MMGGSLPLFIVYGRLSCPYTREALDTLNTSNQTNSFFNVDDSKNLKKLQDLKDNGRVPKDYQTVPVILRSKKFIGGMSELSKLNL